MTNSKRQPYGFGSFVKKFTRPVKKIAKKIVKSPIGKAALLGGGLYGLGSLAGGTGGLSNFGALGSKVGGWFGKNKLLGQLVRDKTTGKLSMGKLGLMGLLGAGATLPFLGGDDEEEIVEEGWETTPASIANIGLMARNRDPSLSFLPSNAYTQSGFYNAASGGLARLANGGGVAEAKAEQMLKMEYQKYRNQGGTMSYQRFKMMVLQQAQGQGPMAQGQQAPQMQAPQMAQPRMAAKGGIMNLGGMEKDYRQEGGFVPLGKKEKADDVPARLSKNEFVFTADAVRNAGGGDIDAGAEVMQNMMDNLEQGGQISKESQGAQGMYNNMKQLETRVA